MLWLTPLVRELPEDWLLRVLLLVFRELFEERVWATMPGAASMEKTSVRVVANDKKLLIKKQF